MRRLPSIEEIRAYEKNKKALPSGGKQDCRNRCFTKRPPTLRDARVGWKEINERKAQQTPESEHAKPIGSCAGKAELFFPTFTPLFFLLVFPNALNKQYT
ncbi:MAG: hypothetical protein FWC38_10470 [Proteobacteria bacterium]|nr:hypothetical protein [Pseudomonadota bacterium]